MKIINTLVLVLILSVMSFADVCNSTYKDLVKIAEDAGFVVTSTVGGRHNIGSRHYLGKAIDISCKMKTDFDIAFLRSKVEGLGFNFRDERIRPMHQAVWGGPHIHISINPCEEQDNNNIEEQT
jgi:hypothetical protein